MYVAPSPDVRRSSPNLVRLLEQLLALEQERKRSHAVIFRGAEVLVHIFSHEAGLQRLFTIELPTFIRGRFTATYEDFLTLEIEAPIKADEITKDR
ncbi:hypothetical protein Rctr197k_018 [Virus Rctr197k]|nr:hypothetical protein Rctr197k_018 [Virus Rctr197k]